MGLNLTVIYFNVGVALNMNPISVRRPSTFRVITEAFRNKHYVSAFTSGKYVEHHEHGFIC